MAGNETRGSPREGAFPRKWMMGLWKETQCLDQSQRRHRSGRDLRLGRLVWQDPAVRFCFYFMSMRVFPVCMSVPHVHGGASGGQKRALGPRELELLMLWRHDAGLTIEPSRVSSPSFKFRKIEGLLVEDGVEKVGRVTGCR